MPQALYIGDAAYAFDLDAIFARSWLFAGFEAEARGRGDYIAMSIGPSPVLIVRGRDGALRAFHNSCRHRGSLLCKPGTGTLARLTCPYHRWTYGLDGALLAAGRMGEDFDKSLYPLGAIQLETVAGAIFICLA
ncbi:MAG: Rieske (2Fe-2S) protein, partial [Sphingomonadaceae bacterium]|nr:Rieske (2Fe-2S) protein [Sphingomonadaceae bacterium]